jgi:hypothetical protein
VKISDDEQYWQQIAAHTNARNSSGAPWLVQLRFASLVGEHGLIAAVVRYDREAPSTWNIVAVTEDGRLVWLRMDFETDLYDREEEQTPFRQQHPVDSTVHEAWARRLKDVVRLDIGKVRQRVDAFGTPSRELNLGDVRLAFADGFEIDLGLDQLTMYDADERASADAFLDAVRHHAAL